MVRHRVTLKTDRSLVRQPYYTALLVIVLPCARRPDTLFRISCLHLSIQTPPPVKTGIFIPVTPKSPIDLLPESIQTGTSLKWP